MPEPDFSVAAYIKETMTEISEIPQIMQDAMTQLQQNNLPEAMALFESVLEMAPEEFDALHILGVLKHKCGEFAQAETLIHQAIAINNDFPDAHYNLAKVLQDQSRQGDAAVSYKNALALDPHMDVAHYNLGLIYLEQENLQDALTSLQQAVKIQADDPDYLFNLGNIYAQLEQLDPAIECYQKLVNRHPSQYIAYNNLGIAYRQRGQLEPAIAAYQQAIHVCPEYADAHFNLGNAFEETRQMREALFCYQKAIEHQPDMAKAYNNLGNVFYVLGDLDKAQNAYETTLTLQPANAFSRHMLNSLTGVASEAAPAQYIEALFDKAAGDFEERLVQDLKYNSPQELQLELLKLLEPVLQFKNALDLGCGTGLSGVEFRALTKQLAGVDISSKMVELAQQKKLYDTLQVGEIIDYLEQSTTLYDLFLATDVLAYFGNLAPLFASIQKHAMKNAYFLFTVEDVEHEDYLLRKTGRFSHSKNYIRTLAEAHKFTIEVCTPTTIRMENEIPITGLNFILRSR
jgi:predicted TPR repeat methyltransferase